MSVTTAKTWVCRTLAGAKYSQFRAKRRVRLIMLKQDKKPGTLYIQVHQITVFTCIIDVTHSN